MGSSPLLDPSILFFVLGLFAGLVRSNLEIPSAIARFLSLYLLMALGLKGGFSLAESGFNPAILRDLMFAFGLALVIPFVSFIVLKSVINPLDALAISATYGSVSAVTFITATQFLRPTVRVRWSHGCCHGVNGIAGDYFCTFYGNLPNAGERQEHQGFLLERSRSLRE